jgi:hypothetical protein
MLSKSVKNIGLKEGQIISLPGAPKYLGPALIDDMPIYISVKCM